MTTATLRGHTALVPEALAASAPRSSRRWLGPARRSPSIIGSAPVRPSALVRALPARAGAPSRSCGRLAGRCGHKMVQRVNDELGPIDILVNNAGSPSSKDRRPQGRRFRSDDSGEFELGVSVHASGAADGAREEMGPHRQHLLRRRPPAPAPIEPHYNASRPVSKVLPAAMPLVSSGKASRSTRWRHPDRNRHDERAGEPRWPDTARPLRQVRRSRAGRDDAARQSLH